MSRYECLATVAREHVHRHQGTFSIVARVLCYSLGLFGVMSISDKCFGDTYTANLSLFMLFSSVFELLWNHTHKGARFWCYILCILGIAISGGLLISQAMHVQAAAASMGVK